MKDIDKLEDKLYSLMCWNCPNARKCHDECETYEEFDKELERMVEENERNV